MASGEKYLVVETIRMVSGKIHASVEEEQLDSEGDP